MQASEVKLQHIIEGTKQYIVPLFQRAYSWSKQEWEILWEDILDLCEKENPTPHFMGSIVTMQTTSVPESVNKYLLIDGQQRLTTVFILLAALRDKAKNSGDGELAKEINDTFLVNPFKKDTDYYKLQPTQVDRQAFYCIIKDELTNDKNSILECFNFFKKKLEQNELPLSQINQIICSNLSLVSIVLNNNEDPYLVFESLNAKGRSLTQADLIRNYFFMRINTDNQQSVHGQYWQPMEVLLEDNLTEFIRHYLAKSGADIRKDEVYFQIKNSLKNGNVIAYLQDLSIFAQYYAKLLDPKREANLSIRKYLDNINLLKVQTVYPFLLNCYDDWQEKRITQENFISILQVIENFLLRRFICDVQTRGLNKIFALLYSQISKDAELASNGFLETLKLNLQDRDYPKDTEFKERLMTVKLYGGLKTSKALLILKAIEESFKHKEQISFDKLNIEHIMPQTLSEAWKEYLGEDWQITHELLLDSLGNLTLTNYNTEMSNAEFSTKQTYLKNSHLELNRYFYHQKSWHKEDIEERAEHLANCALKIWSYFGDESRQYASGNKLKGSTPQYLLIFGQAYQVKNWRDVLEVSLNTVAEKEPDKFKEIVAKFPRFLGWQKEDFRTSRQLKNGVFLNTNLSAKDIHKFCLKAIETAELSSEDWEVKTV